MNLSASFSKRKNRTQAGLFAVSIGMLIGMTGCHIPSLHEPQPGPMMPDTYYRPVFNHAAAQGAGSHYWNSDVQSMPQGNDISNPELDTDDDGMSAVDRILQGNDEDSSSGDDSDELQDRSGDGAFIPNSIHATQASHYTSDLRRLPRIQQVAYLDEPDETLKDAEDLIDRAERMLKDDEDMEAPGTTDQGQSDSGAPNQMPFPGQGMPNDDGTTFPNQTNDFASQDANANIPLNPWAETWQSSAQTSWFQFFRDPMLSSLIQQAFNGNQELRILWEEIRIADLEVLARSGEYRPFVTFGNSLGAEKPGEFTRNGATEEQLEIREGEFFPEPLPDFLTAANLSWEVDIWYKLRNAQSAAALRYLGSQQGRNYVVTRLIAEIAEEYFELLALDNRMLILDKTIEIQQESLKVAEARKAAGRATELGVQRFRAEVQKNQSQKLIVLQQIIEVENRINYLLGRYPQPIQRGLADFQRFIDFNINGISVGSPAQLLQNRPDVLQAEREVEAAGLDVQVARARFYPSVTITGAVGYNAFDPKYLFRTPESLLYGLAGEFISPLINKRAIRADYLSANAKQLQTIYNYQRTILKAFTEVANGMNKIQNFGNSIQVKKRQLAALESSVDVATRLFKNARTEYIDVLLAQRELMEARMEVIETKQEQLAAILKTYQALGGGVR